MASAIGIRAYKIGVSARRRTTNSDSDTYEVGRFVHDFVNSRSTSVQNEEMERSWYFEIKESGQNGSCSGYVHYGTFGFESNFIDAKTKKRNYRRKVSDVEEIPLYFEFWFPKGEEFGFAAFQSFQGRSCINLVMLSMKEEFERKNDNTIFYFSKLLPNDATQNIYRKAPVKKFRLIKRDAPSDLADRYFDNPSPESINFEVSISARRNKNLGNFGSLFKSLKTKSGSVISYDGIDFPEAIAELRIGNRTRRVGILGLNSDAGVIDITDDIKRGADGHPTFKSIAAQTGEILKGMYEVMQGDKT